MEPFEIMISESQERMLCVVEPDRLDAVLARLRALAGQRDGGRRGDRLAAAARVRRRGAGGRHAGARAGRRVPGLRARALAAGGRAVPAAARGCWPPESGPRATLLALLGSANLASRRWAFEQYDCVVGSRTVRRPGEADAAVLLLDPEAPVDGEAPRPALAVAIDGNGRRVACDPYRGAVEAVVECAANLACVGAEPLGLTNCLNFGNPEKPHIAWQLTRAVAGLGDACRALGVPVVGGNVSLYNEGGEGPIFPTPVVGMVGELPDARRAGRLGFGEAGDAVALISAGGWAPSATGSELSKLHGIAPEGELPAADLGELRAVHAAVRQAVRAGVLHSAHDVAEGGLGVALAECCLAGGLGATVDLAGARRPRRCSARARAPSWSRGRRSAARVRRRGRDARHRRRRRAGHARAARRGARRARRAGRGARAWACRPARGRPRRRGGSAAGRGSLSRARRTRPRLVRPESHDGERHGQQHRHPGDRPGRPAGPRRTRRRRAASPRAPARARPPAPRRPPPAGRASPPRCALRPGAR